MKKLALNLSLMFVFAIPTFAGKNPADYLLQIQIIETHWQRHNRDFDGWGRGVIKDGQTVRGFDFTYSSNQHFMRTIGNVHYPGKWKKSPLKLEILVGEIGSVDKYRTYQLKTSVRDDVYVQGPNGAKAVSQDEYKARSIR